MGIFVVFFVFIVFVAPLLVILNGWVLTNLWTWFIVPTFNLPPLGIAAACGLTLIVEMLVFKNGKKTEQELSALFAETTVTSISKALVFLFAGWIIHQFM